MANKKSSTSSLPLANPVFIAAGSNEEFLLDPRYVRIVGSAPTKSSIRTAIPKPNASNTQFNENAKITTVDKIISDVPPQLFGIQLDDITILSGPTSYMDGSNKRYEITFKVNNPNKLKIKDVDYRIAEAQEW